MSDSSLTTGHDVAMRTPSADMIDHYIENLRQRGKSPYTLREWRRLLGWFDVQLPYGLDNACAGELVEFLGRQDWSPATRRAYWQCLTSFYGWALREPYPIGLEENPMDDVPEPPKPHRNVPDPCTDDELSAILARSGDPYLLWYKIAAYCGARCIEVARLDREDVSETSTRLYGKGDKPRAVPTHAVVWHAVRDLPPGPLVRYRAGRRRGQRVTGRYISHMTNAHLHDQLGMRTMHMHRLRDWYATRTLESSGGDLRLVQDLLGHASPGTTAIYTQVSDQRRRAAVGAIPDLAAPCAGSGGAAAATDRAGSPR